MKTEGEILKKIAGKEAKRFLKGILNKVPSQTLSIRYMNSSGLMLISEAILRINLLSISSFGCTGTVVVRPSACFKNTCEPFAWRASNPSFVRALRTSSLGWVQWLSATAQILTFFNSTNSGICRFLPSASRYNSMTSFMRLSSSFKVFACV